jgi:hypothetical protein
MKRYLLAILTLAGAVTTAATSRADTFVSGNICNTRAGTGAANVSFDPYGATNVSTSIDFIVNCALPNPGSAPSIVTMTHYDRSTTQNITCGISAFDSSGNLVIAGHPLNSSAGGPGSGVMQQSVGLPNSSGRTFTVNCTIPKAVVLSGTTWMSHIVGFRVF